MRQDTTTVQPGSRDCDAGIHRRARQLIKDDISFRRTPFIGPAVHVLALFALLVAGVLGLNSLPLRVAVMPVFLLNGIVFYHLAVGIHEASHYTLLSPKWLNELLGNLIAPLIFLNLRNYRKYHMLHHVEYGRHEDPEYPKYETRQSTLASFIATALVVESTGLYAFKRFFEKTLASTSKLKNTPNSLKDQLAVLALLGVVQVGVLGAFLFWSEWWFYFVFWILPLVTVTSFLNRIRLVGEHGGYRYGDLSKLEQPFIARTTFETGMTVTTLPSLIERLLFAPFNFNFHHEHHLFPQVPRHRLHDIYRLFQEEGYYAAHPNNVSSSYLRTLREIFRNPSNAGPTVAIALEHE